MNGDSCPVPEGAPTLQGELLRGVNPYNLRFGAVAAVVLGGLAGVAARASAISANAWVVGIATSTLLFLLLTLIHTFAHALMGGFFELGLKAHCRGRYRTAVWLLALAERPGMDHYDPHGVALDALRDSRQKLRA